MHRRRFLTALAGAPFALGVCAARPARANARPGAPAVRVKSISRDALGTTAVLGLEHAPFPSPGSWYRDDTVIVFVPAKYRYRREEGLAALVHFHGHNTTAERALVAHELREQLADSRQNAILVVPQLAVLAPDSACGKLESPGGLARLLAEAAPAAADAMADAYGDSALPRGVALGTLCVSAHSGGYHAAACSLRFGGVDVRETYLFDALYAELDAFRDWVVARRGLGPRRRHKLVSYFVEAGTTVAQNARLRAELDGAGVLCEYEPEEGELSRRDLSHADAVFVRTGLFHSNVTWETNALRDCLYASTLPRDLPTTWFQRSTGGRPIERRRR